jgi:predicted amino acid dehydrogenase
MRNMSTPNRVTMPKWPAWVLFATMAACAYPAVTASADAAGKQPAPAAAAAVGQPSSLASAFAR